MKKLTLFLSAMLLACATNLCAEDVAITFGTKNTQINAASVTCKDAMNTSWTIATVGTTSFTQQPTYSQVGSGSNPATSITMTGTAAKAMDITAISVKMGGFKSTAGAVTINVNGTQYATGSLNGTSDVTIEGKTPVSLDVDQTIVISVTGIAKGVKIYNITYSTAEQEVDVNTVATPTVTVTGTEVSGSYITSANVEIACATEGASISYSTDGTTWNAYSTALTITKTTTLQAKATKAEMNESAVATKNITIIPSIANTQATALTTAEAIALINATSAAQLAAEKVYVKGTISKIDSYSSQYKSITYWLDNNTFEVYSGKGLNNTNFDSMNDIAVGGEVIIYGNIKKFNSTYEFDKENYLVDYTAPAAPKSVATITLTGNKSTLEAGAADEYTVTYDGDGTLSVTSSNEAVAKAVIVDGKVLVSAVAPGKTTITISAPETDNYLAAEKTYTLTVTAAWAAAALPFEFNGGKAAIDNIVGIKGIGLGDDYKDEPYLKFDDTNDSLLIWYNDKANTLAYTIKGNSFKGGTFDVKESTDGVAFTTVVSITAPESSATDKKNTLKETSRFVLFTYTEKSAGNVALGGIKISYVSNPTAIDNAVVETPAIKTIENGQLIILRDGVKYNAMGVRLQ